MIDAIAAVGDAGDINCWSGIPYHFGKAAHAFGETAAPWRLRIESFNNPRRWWNLGRVLQGQGKGGYQYSRAFLERAEAAISPEQWQGRIVTFNQHFPRGRIVAARGAGLAHYIDATFSSFCTCGGFAQNLPAQMREEACALERENYATSERVVTMARWCADSVVRDCGIPASKVSTILPGANIDLPARYVFQTARGKVRRDRPIVLGFVGKDWERKGLPFLLRVRNELERMGVHCVVRCAGSCPDRLRNEPGLEYVGFIDKAQASERFVDFLASCDVGCLFSDREPLGISTLEFLRAGIPVSGFMVEGVADTVPPDAGFRFEPGTGAEEVASEFRAAFSDEAKMSELRVAAQAWSPLLTWDRAIKEWHELLTTESINDPVRPWTRLTPHEEKK